MMAVGAVGRTLQRAPYSTTNSYVEIAAPGGDFRIDGTTGGKSGVQFQNNIGPCDGCIIRDNTISNSAASSPPVILKVT